MAKGKSRPQRWREAHARAEVARDQIKELMDGELAAALGDLRDIQSEYQDWFDNLPENMQNGAMAEKLQELLNLDLDSIADSPGDDWATADNVIEECGAADLPLGFGRD